MSNKDFANQLGIPQLTRVWSAPQPIAPEEVFYAFFTKDADGTTSSMAVNGAVTNVSFLVKAPAGKIVTIGRVLGVVVDANVSYHGFAGGAELTNGILVRILETDGSVLANLTPEPIKQTHHLGWLAASDIGKIQSGVGVEPDLVLFRWTLWNSGFMPILTAGRSMQFLIRDDLTAVDELSFLAQGRIVDA